MNGTLAVLLKNRFPFAMELLADRGWCIEQVHTQVTKAVANKVANIDSSSDLFSN